MTDFHKGLIFDIRRFSVHDGPGIRTTVFLKGCPLNCIWCHNPESRLHTIEKVVVTNHIGDKSFEEEVPVGKWLNSSEVMDELRKDRIFFEDSGGGVTFSGGEPLFQYNFVAELARQCKSEGLNTALDTCGYAGNEAIQAVLPYIDLYLFDLKGMNNSDHQRHTGVSNETILMNLLLLADLQCEVIIRYPVIPGCNDSEKNIREMMHFLLNIPLKRKEIHLLPYHTVHKSKYKRLGFPYQMPLTVSPDKHSLEKIKQRFEFIGFNVKIGG